MRKSQYNLDHEASLRRHRGFFCILSSLSIASTGKIWAQLIYLLSADVTDLAPSFESAEKPLAILSRKKERCRVRLSLGVGGIISIPFYNESMFLEYAM